MKALQPQNIDEYIRPFPSDIREVLEQVRKTVKATAPEAEEAISYGMPTFNLHGRYLVYFGAYKKHIGFYPAPVGEKAFEKDFAAYKTGKGSVQFPLDEPMPLNLISRIVKFQMGKRA